MDPSQKQADTSNDVHSLEHEGEDPPAAQQANAPAGSGEPAITDASADPSAKQAAPNPFPHRSFIKRLWDKLNVYLMLFIFVMVIAVGALVSLTIKGREQADQTASTQELSPDTLQQLANTDVTVGKPKQILTVQANAVFAGAALIRDNLEVAGALKLGGDLSLPNLLVSGTAKLNDVTATNLTVANSLNVMGTLALKSGISVSGQSNFNGGIVASSVTTGSLQLNGELKLTHHIAAGGTIPVIVKGTAVGGGGTVSLSGSDTSGSITINTGSAPPAGCFATITFSKTFTNTPHVIVTPVGSAAAGLDHYITRSSTQFVLCSANPAPPGQTFGFDYVALN
jgi:cytoskeletal protein CcmA (bactofilin family)